MLTTFFFDFSRLSPTFRALLDSLRTVHTSAKMIAHARLAGGLVRKDAVETVHPLVRVHPITRKKCLFLNGEFITHIQGMKDLESRLLLDFLLNHMITGHDFQCRVRWQPRCVVMFDNRCTIRECFFSLFFFFFSPFPHGTPAFPLTLFSSCESDGDGKDGESGRN